MIANFIPGVKTSILDRARRSLRFRLTGAGIWHTTTFVWGQGETHTLSAPLTQVDSQGRTWQFVSWSNKGSASQSIVVPAGVQGLVFRRPTRSRDKDRSIATRRAKFYRGRICLHHALRTEST